MAQRFSKPFYNTKVWKDTRDYIIKRDRYLCVQCGNPAQEVHHIVWLNSKNIHDPLISLAEDNLISLCRDCHFKVHRDATAKAVAKKNKENKTDTIEGYEFDEDGNVIPEVK